VSEKNRRQIFSESTFRFFSAHSRTHEGVSFRHLETRTDLASGMGLMERHSRGFMEKEKQ